ncbi:conserved hypothetical protein [Gammaproteobacteria bacterium]
MGMQVVRRVVEVGSKWTKNLVVTGFLLVAWATLAVAEGPAPATISLVIDDMGYLLAPGLRAVALPGPLACSILPHTPYAASLAEAAHRAGKEVMLHLPMESQDSLSLGQGGLLHTMDRSQLSQTLNADLALIPHVRGVNNHMGSLLTRQPAAMAWVMDVIKQHKGLFFIDSRTTAATIALKAAQEAGISATRRDLFLDNVSQPAAVRIQFARLVALARIQGTALGIAHPRPVTLQALEDLLPRLPALGVRLRPVSETVVRRAAEPELLQRHNPYGPLPGVESILDTAVKGVKK